MGVSPHTFLCTPQNLLINLKLDQPIRTIRTSKPASKHSHTHTHVAQLHGPAKVFGGLLLLTILLGQEG